LTSRCDELSERAFNVATFVVDGERELNASSLTFGADVDGDDDNVFEEDEVDDDDNDEAVTSSRETVRRA
jgi:hypothetical protein